MNVKKSVALALSSLIVVSVVLPAFSGQASKPSKKPMTVQEFVKTHPNMTVEYRYSKHNAPQSDNLLAANKVKLPANSPVILRLNDTIRGNDSAQGSTISFTVVSDVKVGSEVLVKAGTRAKAQVSMVDDSGLIGQGGKILISDFGTTAVDGSFVPLQGSLSEKGKEKVVLSVGLSLFICPLFLLMKGEEATVPAGMEKTTYTAADVEVNLTNQ